MGGVITKNSKLNKIILYRADHHNSGKFMTFFTNLSGLICSLNASEHNTDKNLNLYVYECDMNLREMNQNMMSSELPPVNRKYINKQYEFCAKIYDLALSNNDNSSNVLESEYGDFFVADYQKIQKICKLKNTYNLNFVQFRDYVDNNKEYQTALKNITSIKENNEVFDKLIKEGIINKPVDGRRSRRSRSLRRTKRKSKRRSKKKI